MKVAAVQMDAGERKASNIAKAMFFVEQALDKKAELVCLPEAFSLRPAADSRCDAAAAAERLPGETLRPFMTLAKQRRAHIVLGTVFERGPGGRVFNTSVLAGPSGRIEARYRKRNLFQAKVRDKKVNEARFFSPGQKNVMARVGSFKMGMTVCYDLRFPELYRQYARAGCDILTAPSSFTRITGAAHWDILVRARAIETLSYVIAPNQVGRDGKGLVSYGNSLIVSPWGDVLARAGGKEEGVIYAEITRGEINKARQALPGIIPKRRNR